MVHRYNKHSHENHHVQRFYISDIFFNCIKSFSKFEDLMARYNCLNFVSYILLTELWSWYHIVTYLISQNSMFWFSNVNLPNSYKNNYQYSRNTNPILNNTCFWKFNVSILFTNILNFIISFFFQTICSQPRIDVEISPASTPSKSNGSSLPSWMLNHPKSG